MPYKSEAQRKYFNVNRKKLEAQGVDVDEWNSASKGKKMPERVKESAIAKLAALSANEINDMDTTSGLVSEIYDTATALTNTDNDLDDRKSQRLAKAGSSFIFQLAKQAVDIETSNPTLLGAGLTGGLLGGAGGALINPGEDENGKKRSRLRNALIGALGGSGVGSAYQYGLNRLNDRLISDMQQQANEGYSLFALKKQAAFSLPALSFAGLGGLLGGAGGALINPGEDENGKKRSRLRNALIGALGGSGVGGVIGYGLDNFGQRTMADIKKIQEKAPVSLFGYKVALAKQAAYKEALNPALLGAGLGGLLGGAGGALINPGEDENGKKRSRLRNALIGALGGAGVGGAAGYMSRPAQPTPSEIGNNLFNEEVAKYKDFKQEKQNPFPKKVPFKQNVADPFEVGNAKVPDINPISGPALAAEMAARQPNSPMKRITNPVLLKSETAADPNAPGRNIADPFAADTAFVPTQEAISAMRRDALQNARALGRNVADPFEVGNAVIPSNNYVYGPNLVKSMVARRPSPPMQRITNPIPLTSNSEVLKKK